jgi:gas vesicle protein
VTNGKPLPKDVIDRWPEVFGEITLNVVPLRYLHAVKITFKNSKVWEIELKKQSKLNWDDFEKQIKDVLSQYEENIENIDFKLDTDKIKKDITKNTNKFLNNKKLK